MLVGVYAAAGGTSTSVVDTTGRALTNSQFHKTIGGWMMSSPVELCVHNICNCVSLYVCMQFAYLLRFPDRAADDDYDATAAAAFFSASLLLYPFNGKMSLLYDVQSFLMCATVRQCEGNQACAFRTHTQSHPKLCQRKCIANTAKMPCVVVVVVVHVCVLVVMREAHL